MVDVTSGEIAEREAVAARLNGDFPEFRIVDVQTLMFRYRSRLGYDVEGHAHPVPERDAIQTLTRVRTSAGGEGYCFGGSAETAAVATELIAGLNPLDREAIWYRLLRAQRLKWRALGDRH